MNRIHRCITPLKIEKEKPRVIFSFREMNRDRISLQNMGEMHFSRKRKNYPKRRWRLKCMQAVCSLHIPNLCHQSCIEIVRTFIVQSLRYNKSQSKLTFTVQSLDAVITRIPSWVKMASFTYDVCPRNSFNNLPDFSPCILWHNHRQNVIYKRK